LLIKMRKTNLLTLSLVVCLALLTACSNSSQDTESRDEITGQTLPETEVDQRVEKIGTGGQLISIQSSNVRAAGYDANTMIMTVQFDSGYIYEYYGVPAELWTSFIAAQPDPWSQVGYPRLVQGGVPYKRIG
jgi:hypothetical protein